MKTICSLTNEDFEAEFLKSEWYKKVYHPVREQFNKIVLEPNTKNQEENNSRHQLLWQWRYPLLERLPNNISWQLASIDEGEFENLLIIRETYWEKTFGDKKTLADVARAILDGVQDNGAGINIIQNIKRAIGTYPFAEKIICISISLQPPFSIIEGNHRAVAFQLKKLEVGGNNHIPKEIILGVSSNMVISPWLNFATDTPAGKIIG